MKTSDQSSAKVSFLRSPVARQPRPPRHLTAAGKRWWRSVVDNFVMEPTDLRVLTLAAESFDAAEAARKMLVEEGTTYRDDKGILHPHPCIRIQKDSATLAARLIRDLKLDLPPARAPGRPPGPGPTPKRSY